MPLKQKKLGQNGEILTQLQRHKSTVLKTFLVNTTKNTDLLRITRNHAAQAFIDYLQKSKSNEMLAVAAADYKKKRAELVAQKAPAPVEEIEIPVANGTKSLTFAEFAVKWVPIHARKQQIGRASCRERV